METEIWKDAIGYEGLYQVSNLGRVKSLEKEVKGKANDVYLKKERVLKQIKKRTGYLSVTLCKDGIKKQCSTHRLVAQSFLDDYNESLQVNHLDEDKTNNNINNLEMCTCKENINYGTRTDRMKKTKNKVVLQFTLNDEFIKEFPSLKEAASFYNFTNTCISRCCLGKCKTAYNFIWRYK